MSGKTEIFVTLLDEGVDVWKPIKAELIRENIFKILDQPYDQDIEIWQFAPGDEVVCETIETSQGKILAAVRKT